MTGDGRVSRGHSCPVPTTVTMTTEALTPSLVGTEAARLCLDSSSSLKPSDRRDKTDPETSPCSASGAGQSDSHTLLRLGGSPAPEAHCRPGERPGRLSRFTSQRLVCLSPRQSCMEARVQEVGAPACGLGELVRFSRATLETCLTI